MSMMIDPRYEMAVPLFVLLLSVPFSSAVATEKLVHAFQGGSDGFAPQAGVIADTSGNLYGTTAGGGVAARIVFKAVVTVAARCTKSPAEELKRSFTRLLAAVTDLRPLVDWSKTTKAIFTEARGQAAAATAAAVVPCSK